MGRPARRPSGAPYSTNRANRLRGLEQAARAKYQYFVGDLWDRYGADAWLGTWQQVYARPQGGDRAVVSELRAIKDRSAAQSVELLLDEAADPQGAQQALAAAFDDPAVTELAVYKIGDGAALAGILVAARRAPAGETVILGLLARLICRPDSCDRSNPSRNVV